VEVAEHDGGTGFEEPLRDGLPDAARGTRDDGVDAGHVHGQRYFLSSARASEFLCTSSGPSANRSVRMPANHSASGKSWLNPPAPCTWIALSRIHSTVWGVAILMAWISVCAPRLPAVSMSHAVFRTRSRSCSMRTRDSAIQSRTTPWSAMGLPTAPRA